MIASLVCVAVVASASGVAAAVLTSGPPADHAPLQLAPGLASTQTAAPSLGGDASSITDTIKARVPNIVSLTLSEDPITSASGTSTFQALVVHVKVAESAAGGAGVAQAMWTGNLVGGAVKTAFSQARLTVPESVDVTLVRPDGSTDHIGGGMGNVVPNQQFDSVSSDVQSTVLKNAALEGFANVRFSTFAVVDDVIQIQAATSESPPTAANSFMHAGGLGGLLGQSVNDFEGVYFELDDETGKPLLINAANPRDGAGVFWADPSTGLQDDMLRTSK